MKHFEISYRMRNTYFTFMCSTAYEAFNALEDMGYADSSIYFFDIADRLMEVLVQMKAGEMLTFENSKFIIRYVDGEV